MDRRGRNGGMYLSYAETSLKLSPILVGLWFKTALSAMHLAMSTFTIDSPQMDHIGNFRCKLINFVALQVMSGGILGMWDCGLCG